MPIKKKTISRTSKKKTEKKKVIKKKTEKKAEPKKSALEKLKEKAKALEKKVELIDTKEIKEQIKEQKKDKKTLVPVEDYIKTGTYIGTRAVTPQMRKYVYKRRADGLAVLNTLEIDKGLQNGIEFISKFEPEDIILACKREVGWTAVRLFSKLTGIKNFTKKYPAGILTNTQLEIFIEPKLIIVCDPWIDKNALSDANKTNRKVLGLCDTNNFTKGIDVIIPCNNKSSKGLGLILYYLAEGFIKNKKIKVKMPRLKEFVGEEI